MRAPAPPKKGGADDVDWDDDDEVTSVYNAEAHGNPAGLGPLPSEDPTPPISAARIGAPPPVSRPAPEPPAARSRPDAAAAFRREASLRSPPPTRTSPLTYVLIGFVMIASVAALVWVLVPKQGTLVINVSGPGGTAVEMVSILVDDAERCARSACRVEGIPAGAHTVRVVAPGFVKAADKAVLIESGGTAILDFSLVPAGGSAAAGGVTGTGLRVGELGAGLSLTVDGVDRGELPAVVADLSPGEHTIRISGSDRFEPYEERVTVEAGVVKSLEPTLRAKKGVLEVVRGANAEGATVTLVCGTDRRLLAPPTKVEIDVNQSCAVKARKAGFPEFSSDVRFAGPKAEALVTIAFGAPAAGLAAPAAPGPTPPPAWLPGAVPAAPVTPGAPAAPVAAAPAPAAGTGTISVNSIPVSSVLVDGKPVGQTPTRVTVAAGPHTVTFIHPEKGRKSVGVQVTAGGNSVAATRF